MTRLLLATTNPDKRREIQHVLGSQDVEILTLSEFGAVAEPDETGDTFQENARLKGQHYAAAVAQHPAGGALLVVAEDSGLVVDALHGEPGVRSARFLRSDASYPERFAEIYRRLAAHPDRPRTARFVCALAVVRGTSVVFETTGTIEGEISPDPRGTNGFGYDPIFFYPPYGCTLAEVGDDRKLRVAHRGHAFRNFADWLRTSQQMP